MPTAISGVNIGLTIHGAVDPRLGNTIFPSGDNIEFGYWRSYKNDSVSSGSGIFNQIFIPFDGTGVTTESQFNQVRWKTGEDSNGKIVTTTTCPHSEITWTAVKAEMDKL